MYRSSFFLLVLGLVAAIKFAEKLSPVVGELSGKVELLLIFTLAFFALFSLRGTPRPLVWCTGLILLGLLFGLRTPLNQYRLGQLLIDLKLPLALWAAYGFASQRLVVGRMREFFTVLLWVNLALVIFLYAAPVTYHRLFPNALISTTVTGTTFRRAVGAFVHPGPFGIFSGIALLYFFAYGTSFGWTGKIRTGALLATTCLLASGQRLEALAIVFMGLALFVILHAKRPLVLVSLLLAGFLGLVTAGSGIFALYRTAAHNLSSSADPDAVIPRALLLSGAVRLANAEFPGGSGLGTYASSMSLVNPATAYVRSGVARAWWFGKKSFITDTYWAKALGETGWAGAVNLLAAYLLMMVGPALDAKASTPVLAFAARLAFLVLGFGLLDSVGAPIYTGSAFPILLLALTYGYYLKTKIHSRGAG